MLDQVKPEDLDGFLERFFGMRSGSNDMRRIGVLWMVVFIGHGWDGGVSSRTIHCDSCLPKRHHGSADDADAGSWVEGVQCPDTQYRQLRNQPLNDQHPELRVTVLQELDLKGKDFGIGHQSGRGRYGTGGSWRHGSVI